jgi:hypothetical protein
MWVPHRAVRGRLGSMKLPGTERPSEALRTAIERTFEATAGSAASTRDRAVDLLDEIAKRGRDVRDQVGDQLGKIESTVRGKRKG